MWMPEVPAFFIMKFRKTEMSEVPAFFNNKKMKGESPPIVNLLKCFGLMASNFS
jgi:hypothetical protein